MGSSYRSRFLACTSLAHFVNDGTVFFVPLIAVIIADTKLTSPLLLTIMFVVFWASSSIFSTYVGAVADRSGRPASLIGLGIGLLSSGIAGFYISMSYADGMLLTVFVVLSALVAGSGSAFTHPLAAAVLESVYGEKDKGKALGINGAVGSFGRALYPSLFFLVASFLSQVGSIAFFALLGFVASVIIWIGLRQREISSRSAQPASQTGRREREVITTGIVVLTLVAFVRSLAVGGLLNWIPTYLSLRRGLGVTSNLGYTLTAMYAAAIIGQPIFGVLVDRFDKRLVLGLSSIGSALSILGYLFATGPLDIVLLSLFGFFTFSAFPLLLSLASEHAPREQFSLGNALVWGLGVSGGTAIGPAITGAIVTTDYANLGFAFEIMAFIALLSALGTIFIPKPERSRKVPLFG